MKYVGTIALGALITFIILVFMAGDIATAGAIYIGSIVCTLGISLILWLPLWYGVGWIVTAIFKTIEGHLGPEKDKGITSAAEALPQTGKLQALTERLNQELHNDPALARNQAALLNYISKAREKGLSNQQITLNLANTGWPADHINQAFTTLNQQSNP